jgi:hypothetical protein
MEQFGKLRKIRVLASAALALGCGSRSGLELEAVPSPDTQALPARPVSVPAQPPPQPARSGCVETTRSYSSEPASVMLLIDQSGSMTARFGNSTRWDVLRQAIVDPDKGLLAWLDESARVGLMLYSSQNGSLGGNSCPLITEVPIAIDDIDQVRSEYLAAQPLPRGDTPTGESIDRAVQRLTQMQSDAPKYLLVLTDGDPDTCAQPNPQLGMPQAIAAVQNAIAQGVRHVYTVGVSEDISGANLQAMANAGAGKDPALIFGQDAAAEQPLFASTDPEQLASQLEGVIGDIRTCTISLGQWAGASRGLDGRISLDGQTLEFGSADGWSFVDDATLRIHGTACQKILGDGQKLEISFPCLDDAPPSEIPR